MMFANKISSSTSCSIWLPETSPPSSSRGVLRHRFESCNTSVPRLSSLRPLPILAEDLLLPDFCSGAARLSGRFSEGFSLRRSQYLPASTAEVCDFGRGTHILGGSRDRGWTVDAPAAAGVSAMQAPVH